jgi:hypothetical protein
MYFHRVHLHRWVELLLGIVLASAACLKALAYYLDSTLELAGLLDRRLMPLLIVAEFILAFWMAFGGLDRARFIFATATFCLLSLASFYEAIRYVPNCGCFGRLDIPPTASCVFDVTAVIALMLTRDGLPLSNPTQRRFLKRWAATALILTFAATYCFAHSPRSINGTVGDAFSPLTSDDWAKSPDSLFDSIAEGDKLRTGQWTLVFYHFNCPVCRDAIQKYRAIDNALRAQPNRPRLAFVAVPPITTDPSDPGHASNNAAHFILKPDRELTTAMPVVVTLRDGKVSSITTGDQAAHPQIILPE